jgi:hypothetical protein
LPTPQATEDEYNRGSKVSILATSWVQGKWPTKLGSQPCSCSLCSAQTNSLTQTYPLSSYTTPLQSTPSQLEEEYPSCSSTHHCASKYYPGREDFCQRRNRSIH